MKLHELHPAEGSTTAAKRLGRGVEKKIQIRIDHRRDGKEVCVEVFNTGNPIPDEALPNLWTKFYKVDKARTREYGGSGLKMKTGSSKCRWNTWKKI